MRFWDNNTVRNGMTKTDDAERCFRSGFTCSAAVFSAFSDDLGLDAETAKKLACGFGGGISHTGNICGALSGAILAIGLKYGKTREDDDAATGKTRATVQQFIREFVRKYGSINCTELLAHDLSNPDDLIRAREKGLFKTKCPALVRDAAEILEKVL
jgi:C_GCAxxG_C_C family probable redox protein